MESVNYHDFKNICRICLLPCGDTFSLNFVISKIYYMLLGFTFETNDELPQQICYNCSVKVIEIDEFAFKCKQGHSSLIKCLENYKNEELNENIQETSKFLKSEIIIDEHKIEFFKNEEMYLTNENLQLKQNTTEDTNNEMIYDPNKNSVQDDSNKNVVKEEMSDENTNKNDLKDDANSSSTDSTSITEVSNEISERSYKYDLYLKAFKRKINLNNHRPLMCEVCNKTFKFLSQFNIHKRTHSNERPYVCENCNKTFSRSNDLTRHKRIHSGERPYKCEICNKTFNHSSYLNVHERIHRGERPYSCEICHKAFSQSSGLSRHERIHSGERPYKREISNKTFTN